MRPIRGNASFEHLGRPNRTERFAGGSGLGPDLWDGYAKSGNCE